MFTILVFLVGFAAGFFWPEMWGWVKREWAKRTDVNGL